MRTRREKIKVTNVTSSHRKLLAMITSLTTSAREMAGSLDPNERKQRRDQIDLYEGTLKEVIRHAGLPNEVTFVVGGDPDGSDEEG